MKIVLMILIAVSFVFSKDLVDYASQNDTLEVSVSGLDKKVKIYKCKIILKEGDIYILRAPWMVGIILKNVNEISCKRIASLE